MFFFITTLLSATIVAGATQDIESKPRFLEDQSTAENDYPYLVYYSMKMISCSAGTYTASQSGAEYGAILFRLCPNFWYTCNDDPGMGCDSGYGDYLVGINTFVKEYLENKGDEMQLSDDNFQIEELAECRQYNADNDSDYADGVYYVGPTCTADGTGVRMALFNDERCTSLEEKVTFEDISAGITLPYAGGGLVSQSCESCSTDYEDKNGDVGVTEMCVGLYEQAYYKCETQIAISPDGSSRDDSGCDLINSFLPRLTKESEVLKVLGWSFFAIAILGLAAFVVTTMKKKKRCVMEVDKNSFVVPPID